VLTTPNKELIYPKRLALRGKNLPIFEMIPVDNELNFAKTISMIGLIHRGDRVYSHRFSTGSFNPWRVNP